MAVVNARIAPFINVEFEVTAEFGHYPSGGEHNGLDISTGRNDNLYSIVDGVITDKGFQSGGYGNYIVMKDSQTEQGFLYGHMKEPSPLSVGDRVTYGTFVGIEGTTGLSTAEHLHLGSQDMTGKNHWTFGLPISQLLNPALWLDIPNVLGTLAIYNGTPLPFKRNSRKWLEAKSFRCNIKLR